MGARPVDKQYKIRQEFFFIIADFLKPLALGNGSAKILKTVSISKDSSNDLVTENFDNLNYQPLRYYNFQSLGFSLEAEAYITK